jgi:hypothetical protein
MDARRRGLSRPRIGAVIIDILVDLSLVVGFCSA